MSVRCTFEDKDVFDMVTCLNENGCQSANCFDAGRCLRPWASALFAQSIGAKNADEVAADVAEVMGMLIGTVTAENIGSKNRQKICPAYFDSVFTGALPFWVFTRKFYKQLYRIRGAWIENVFLGGTRETLPELMLYNGVRSAVPALLEIHPSPSDSSVEVLKKVKAGKLERLALKLFR